MSILPIQVYGEMVRQEQVLLPEHDNIAVMFLVPILFMGEFQLCKVYLQASIRIWYTSLYIIKIFL